MQTRPERRKPGRKSKGPRVQVPVRLPTEFYEAVEARGKRVTRFDAKAGRLIAAPGGRTAADKKAGTREKAMAGGPTARAESSRS